MFALYPTEKSIFAFEDYAVLLEYARGKRSALEFGPGVSTLALIEAGCERIVTCEHLATWYSSAAQRFAEEPAVEVRRYQNRAKVAVDGLGWGERFDIAFVDSPVGDGGKRHVRHSGQEECSRWNTVEFALRHADLVLLHDAKRPGEQETLKRAHEAGCSVIVRDTRKGIAVIERAA